MTEQTYMDLMENYLRLDQELKLAKCQALLDHADLAQDLREARAALDTEDLHKTRLEALIALERAKLERDEMMSAALSAVGRSHTIVADNWERNGG